MRKWWNAVLALSLLAAAVLAPGTGQAAVGTELNGQVSGLGGEPLAGTELELFQLGTGRVAVTRADDEGFFRFAGLDDTGVYWVRPWAPGYQVADGNWSSGLGTTFLTMKPAPLTADLMVHVRDQETGAPVAGASVDLQRTGQGRIDLATTAASGSVRLQAEAGGGYSLRVWAAGYTPAVITLPDLAGGVTRTVTAALPAAATPVTGLAVSMPGGLPLAGATIHALRSGYGVVATATTDRAGTFALELPAGAEYVLRATAVGHAPAATTTFTLVPGRSRDFSGEERLQLVAATATLTGRLLNPDGKPLTGRTVWLQRRPFGTVAEALTAADGTFRFAGVRARPGLQYRVQVLPANLPDEHLWKAVGSPWTELAGGQTTEVLLQITKGPLPPSLSDGAVAGTILDAAGRPFAGAEVELWQEGKGLVRRTTTGDAGGFRFDKVPANHWSLPIVVPYNGYFLKVSGNDILPTTLATDAAFAVQPQRDTLVSATVYPRRVPLQGRALAEHGAPLAGVQVTLVPDIGDRRTATSDASGRWQVPQADPLAVYQALASRTGHRRALAVDVTPDPAGAATLDLTLPAQNATLSGAVTDTHGRPLTGATVTAWLPDDRLHTTTTAGDDGRFQLTVIAGQPYLLTAQAPGHTPTGLGPDAAATAAGAVAVTGAGPAVAPALVAAPVRFPAPGTFTETDLRLWPAHGRVLGIVTGADGRPVPGIALELVQVGAGVIQYGESDGNGRYRFTRVPASGRYAVRPARGGYRYADSIGMPALFTLEAGGVQSVHLEIGPQQP